VKRAVITLADVARRAGVSLATASRVLNASTRQVNPDLRDRVLRSAAELGYIPNAHAQALARNTTNVLGLVVHDIADPYFSSIASGVMRIADQHGLITTLGSTFRDPEREVEYVTTLRSQRARAIVLVGSRFIDERLTERLATEITAYQVAGGRVACVSQQRLPADTIQPENRAGARSLAHELAQLGHVRHAVLAGPPNIVTARDRLTGFRQGLRAAGVDLDPAAVIEGPFTRDGGYEAASELLRKGLEVTSVFAVNDVMAVGAMAAFRDKGIDVPVDISVAGFDDIATLRDLVPRLTTVRLPLEKMGARAAGLALETDAIPTPRLVRMRAEVVIRESTRKIDQS
jgi:LacI family transcriptional regulator